MSMAARAVNSRAVSSISLEGIGDIYPEAVARGRGGRRGRDGGRVTRSRQVERSQQPPGLGTPDRVAEGQRIVVRDPLPPPPAAPPPRHRLPCFSSRLNFYSTESTSACHDASMILSATPTVPQVSLPSPEVMRTRVLAAVAFDSSRIRTL